MCILLDLSYETSCQLQRLKAIAIMRRQPIQGWKVIARDAKSNSFWSIHGSQTQWIPNKTLCSDRPENVSQQLTFSERQYGYATHGIHVFTSKTAATLFTLKQFPFFDLVLAKVEIPPEDIIAIGDTGAGVSLSDLHSALLLRTYLVHRAKLVAVYKLKGLANYHMERPLYILENNL